MAGGLPLFEPEGGISKPMNWANVTAHEKEIPLDDAAQQYAV
jgi:hypothetical protein